MIIGGWGLWVLTLCGEVTCCWKRPLFFWDLCSHQPNWPKSSILSHTLRASQSHHTQLILQQTILSCGQKTNTTRAKHTIILIKFTHYSKYHSNTQLIYSQDFHLESVHPPNVSVEDEVVHPFPILPMLLYRFGHDDTVLNAVHRWVVRIRFHEEWRPVELHRCIILLLHYHNIRSSFTTELEQLRNFDMNLDSEDRERSSLLERFLAWRHDGLDQAHHRLPLIPVQWVPNEHEPLPSNSL